MAKIHSLTLSKTGFRITWKCGAHLDVPARNMKQARAFACLYLADLR